MHSIEKKIIEIKSSKKQYWKIAEHATPFKLFGGDAVWTRLKRALCCIQSETTAWNRSPQQRLLALDLINVEGPQSPPKITSPGDSQPQRECARRPKQNYGPLPRKRLYVVFARGTRSSDPDSA